MEPTIESSTNSLITAWRDYVNAESIIGGEKEPAYANQALVPPVNEMRKCVIDSFKRAISEVCETATESIIRVVAISTHPLELFGYDRGDGVFLPGLLDIMQEVATRENRRFELTATCYVDKEREVIIDYINGQNIEERYSRIDIEVVSYDIEGDMPRELKQERFDVLVATLVTIYVDRDRQLKLLSKEWPRIANEMIIASTMNYCVPSELREMYTQIEIRKQRLLEKIVGWVLRPPCGKEYNIREANSGIRGVINKVYMLVGLLKIMGSSLSKINPGMIFRNVKRLLDYTRKVVEPLTDKIEASGKTYYWGADFVKECIGSDSLELVGGHGVIRAHELAYPWLVVRLRRSA